MSNYRGLWLLVGFVALSGACRAAQPAPGSVAVPMAQGLPKVCLDAQSGSDPLIAEFADRLKETINASGTLSLASPTDACNLQLHVPGNLLRFQTAGAVMVSTVVIVTSPSGRYLSTSISACRAAELQPCAVRAVAAAKLALLLAPNEANQSSEVQP
jgi:hypothetical protein